MSLKAQGLVVLRDSILIVKILVNGFEERYSIAIAADMQMLSNGMVLLAVGTTKRSIDLYCETACSKAVKRALSITAHEDWVHSIAFNRCV
ncbi:hypothetical protein OSTOST_05972 [Ostertagia ostertagi]